MKNISSSLREVLDGTICCSNRVAFKLSLEKNAIEFRLMTMMLGDSMEL